MICSEPGYLIFAVCRYQAALGLEQVHSQGIGEIQQMVFDEDAV